MANWNKEDIDIVEKFISIKNKGLYADGSQVTDVYNRVLGKSVRPTNCGSCIRGRIQELETALNAFKRLAEAQKQAEPTEVTPEENNATEPTKPRRVGRPKKKAE
ncbi:MAG: hypothetical protein J6S67_06325 [Methanobrevibacter sp.]|nr:hypothetical protein [Methanobrevibacter sp.]